jgi:hypothetical protein
LYPKPDYALGRPFAVLAAAAALPAARRSAPAA